MTSLWRSQNSVPIKIIIIIIKAQRYFASLRDDKPGVHVFTEAGGRIHGELLPLLYMVSHCPYQRYFANLGDDKTRVDTWICRDRLHFFWQHGLADVAVAHQSYLDPVSASGPLRSTRFSFTSQPSPITVVISSCFPIFSVDLACYDPSNRWGLENPDVTKSPLLFSGSEGTQ